MVRDFILANKFQFLVSGSLGPTAIREHKRSGQVHSSKLGFARFSEKKVITKINKLGDVASQES